MREEFLNKIVEAIKEKVGTECKVLLRKVKKNNGLVLQAIEIWEPGASETAEIYIDSLLDRVEAYEIGLDEAAREVIRINKELYNNEFTDMVKRIDKRYVLANVTYQLVNKEKNRERLSDMHYRDFLDLAVVYRVIVAENGSETCSFAVKNVICKKYGISGDELESAARRNTEGKGFQMWPIASIIAEAAGVQEEDCEGNIPMWVFSNDRRHDGAAVMLYEGYFDILACRIESDLYIIPSSIHEVIAVPDNGMDKDELRAIVRMINSSEVPEDEVLSENVYRYCRKEKSLVIA